MFGAHKHGAVVFAEAKRKAISFILKARRCGRD